MLFLFGNADLLKMLLLFYSMTVYNNKHTSHYMVSVRVLPNKVLFDTKISLVIFYLGD